MTPISGSEPTGICKNVLSSCDMGCGSLERLASGGFATVLRYRRAGDYADATYDHVYPSHALVVTVSGEWHFHGSRMNQRIDARNVVAGRPAQDYACHHDRGVGSESLIFVLRSNALDGNDEGLFGRDIVASSPDFLTHRNAIIAALKDTDRLEALTFSIYDTVSLLSHDTRPKRRYDVRMAYVARAIEERYAQRVVLEHLASEVGLSPFTLARRFRAHSGTSVHAYLTNCRIEYAKRALLKLRVPIDEIAANSGFGSFSHFSSSFHRIVGTTPSHFRSDARL